MFIIKLVRKSKDDPIGRPIIVVSVHDEPYDRKRG